MGSGAVLNAGVMPSADLAISADGTGSNGNSTTIAPFAEPTYKAIAQTLQKHLRRLTPDDESLATLSWRFSRNEVVDYERLGEAFTYRYFLTNYWKAALALAGSRPAPPTSIVDLGCGSAAATIAALAWADSAHESPGYVHVTLVDQSRTQLETAQELLEEASRALPRLRLNVFVAEDRIDPQLSRWRPAIANADLVLASHFLTENAGTADTMFRSLRHALTGGAFALVVERADDPVWLRLDLHRSVSARHPAEGLPLNGLDRDLPRELALRWLVTESVEDGLRELVARYFRAWHEQSVPALDEVFDQDAVYHEKPFSDPIHGLDGIRQYWRQRVLPQADPEPHVIHLSTSRDCAFVEWETKLRVKGTSKVVKGAMIVEPNERGDRIARLREYFRSSVSH